LHGQAHEDRLVVSDRSDMSECTYFLRSLRLTEGAWRPAPIIGCAVAFLADRTRSSFSVLGSFSALWGRLRLAGQRQKSRILQENQAVVRQQGANPPGRFHCLATNIIFDRFLVLCVKTKLREVSILCDFGITSLTLEHRQARPSASASSALPNRRRSLADDR
jgi:hypothetical protein